MQHLNADPLMRIVSPSLLHYRLLSRIIVPFQPAKPCRIEQKLLLLVGRGSRIESASYVEVGIEL